MPRPRKSREGLPLVRERYVVAGLSEVASIDTTRPVAWRAEVKALVQRLLHLLREDEERIAQEGLSAKQAVERSLAKEADVESQQPA